MRRIALLAACMLAAGCGAGAKHAAPAGAGCPPPAAQRRALTRARADTAAMWRVARLPETHLAAIRALTDRFLADAVDVPPLRRNRLIDVAAGAATAASCPDCFQALEASRTIPSLRYSNAHCG